MSVFTFTSAMMSDLDYQLDDRDIANDIMIIDGVPGSEVLVRGVSATSCQLYGRRSKKIERPLAASQATAQDLVEAQLDKYCFEGSNPMCHLTATIPIVTDVLMAIALSLNISDEVTIQVPVMGLDEDFWVDDIEFDFSKNYGELRLALVEKA